MVNSFVLEKRKNQLRIHERRTTRNTYILLIHVNKREVFCFLIFYERLTIFRDMGVNLFQTI